MKTIDQNALEITLNTLKEQKTEIIKRIQLNPHQRNWDASTFNFIDHCGSNLRNINTIIAEIENELNNI